VVIGASLLQPAQQREAQTAEQEKKRRAPMSFSSGASPTNETGK
jgi:hypothetical protein